MEVVFRAIYPWALLPRKIKIDAGAKQAEVRIFEENFRWVRISRSAELCWPWRLAQETGWVIHSPVTIAMDALHDVEAVCPPADNRSLSVAANCSEVWTFTDSQGNLQRNHYTAQSRLGGSLRFSQRRPLRAHVLRQRPRIGRVGHGLGTAHPAALFCPADALRADTESGSPRRFARS